MAVTRCCLPLILLAALACRAAARQATAHAVAKRQAELPLDDFYDAADSEELVPLDKRHSGYGTRYNSWLKRHSGYGRKYGSWLGKRHSGYSRKYSGWLSGSGKRHSGYGNKYNNWLGKRHAGYSPKYATWL